MSKSDAHAAKCAKLGLVFQDVYPDEYAEYLSANERYNDNEKTLAEHKNKLAMEKENEFLEIEDKEA